MKKIIKRIILTVMFLICGFFVYFVGGLWYGFYQEHRSISIGMQNVEGARVNAERTTKIHEFAMILEQGSKYEKEGNYDRAVEQYKKVLAMNEDEWMARCMLADAYTKSDQHELALQEVIWIISQNPREEVKEQYLIRKQLLEKLINSKKAVSVPNPDQTAFLLS